MDEEPPTVLFTLKALASERVADHQTFDCTYEENGKIAKFQLQFRSEATGKDFPVAWGEGRFVAVKGSDNSALIAALQKALEAKNIPKKSARLTELPFGLATLGERQSRSSSGSFASEPPGNWVLLKLFLPKGGDEGEVYLNVDPIGGKGEFSIKDDSYGDYLLAQFAKVL